MKFRMLIGLISISSLGAQESNSKKRALEMFYERSFPGPVNHIHEARYSITVHLKDGFKKVEEIEELRRDVRQITETFFLQLSDLAIKHPQLIEQKILQKKEFCTFSISINSVPKDDESEHK